MLVNNIKFYKLKKKKKYQKIILKKKFYKEIQNVLFVNKILQHIIKLVISVFLGGDYTTNSLLLSREFHSLYDNHLW